MQKLRSRQQETVGAEIAREGTRSAIKEKARELNDKANEEANKELARTVQARGRIAQD